MIETYKKAKTEFALCQQWANLIGSYYEGGGGGIGRLVSVLSSSGSLRPVIYYQEKDGDKNYHDMPIELREHFAAAITEKFDELLQLALVKQQDVVRGLAAASLTEYSELAKEAGLQI